MTTVWTTSAKLNVAFCSVTYAYAAKKHLSVFAGHVIVWCRVDWNKSPCYDDAGTKCESCLAVAFNWLKSADRTAATVVLSRQPVPLFGLVVVEKSAGILINTHDAVAAWARWLGSSALVIIDDSLTWNYLLNEAVINQPMTGACRGRSCLDSLASPTHHLPGYYPLQMSTDMWTWSPERPASAPLWCSV